MAADLLAWYDRHARRLPWRSFAPHRPDPYHVWLSEIMLQQTTVAAVRDYFEKFLRLWPRVEDLAGANPHDVLTAWAGLGYYARARNLHKCAVTVAKHHNGRFPETEEELRKLPGIGPYTAAAIAAIAFDRPATVLDGNVERVMSRLYRVTTALPKAKAELRVLAEALTPARRPGDYGQAVMDLGATICTPRQPRCSLCPWDRYCAGRAEGDAETFPRRAAKPDRPQRYGVAFWMMNDRGEVALRRRPERGLLGGMMEFPGTDWRARPWSQSEALKSAPVEAAWKWSTGSEVRHVFTHFSLAIGVAMTRIAGSEIKDIKCGNLEWIAVDRLGQTALPSVMRKVAVAVLGAEARGWHDPEDEGDPQSRRPRPTAGRRDRSAAAARRQGA